jgi:DNA replication protein DnaC
MNINIKQNKKPKLCMPSFNVDNELSSKLNKYEITKLMNKSNFTLFLGKAGSGKTSLMTSFLKTKQ